MSEEILKALMQLFGLITKQDGGVGQNETEYVRTFLKQQLNSEAVEEYFSLFLNYSDEEKRLSENKGDEKEGKVQLTSMKDSVRILGICKKINKQLNREQKVVVLVRLYELVSSDMKLTDQRMAIINTVADVFKIPKNEIIAIEAFVLHDSSEKLNFPEILIADDIDHENSTFKHIKTYGLNGSVIVLNVKSAELYFMRNVSAGDQEIFLNGFLVNNKNVYIFPKGSFVRLPKGKPIYYTDVVSRFLSDTDSARITYEVKNVWFKFKSGDLGLRNINISEEQGRLIGVMGASGAGKTTLLNVLAGLETPTEGEVLINGINMHIHKDDKLNGVIGLIPQDDLLIEELTVFENLFYNAKLCFKDKSDDDLTNLVNETLQSLGLFERRNLKVGSPLNKTISGGQRKRLNIALELIRQPSVLFVDEPTSGLSSRDSENVMNLLSELALKGKLIFVVIHQPSSDIYKMFDKMYILDTGGYPVYYGNPSESLIYFKQLDAQINSDQGECPNCGNLNPEMIFNIIDSNVIDEYGNYTNKRKTTPEEWNNHFNELQPIPKVETATTPTPRNLNIPSWFGQFWIYTIRDIRAKISNTQYIILNLIEAPLLGLILTLIIRYISDPTSNIYIFRENENIPPYIFMSAIVALFLGLIVSAEEIFKDAKILKREAFLNLSRSGYLCSKILILFTISAIQMAMFVAIGNSILEVKDMYFKFWIALFTIAASANMLGLILSASFNSVATIYIFIPLVMIPQMILGGAMFTFDKLNKDFTSIDKVPAVAEIMPSRYIYEGLVVDQYKFNKFKKNIFDVEMAESKSDFKQVYYIPELRDIIAKLEPDNKRSYKNDLELLRNEFSKEQKRVPEIKIDFIADIKPELFNDEIIQKSLKYLDELLDHYRTEFNKANSAKDRWLTTNLDRDATLFNSIKDDYFNEMVSRFVRKELDKNKILRQGNHLVQVVDPIYQIPEPKNKLAFRTHFFAPEKHFAGFKFETLWFNITIVWILTIIMYVVLYYDLFKKSMDWLGEIRKKKR
ncbi:MAG: ATP-binding cassette domain-containing protein [Marinilabiliaceae bacterium]|nr:ATP-binding cassette domain-containing protein [Marinilabiliaceae bacterium]